MFRGFVLLKWSFCLHKCNVSVLRRTFFIFPMVVKSCAQANAIREGEQVRYMVAKPDFKSNTFVGITFIHM